MAREIVGRLPGHRRDLCWKLRKPPPTMTAVHAFVSLFSGQCSASVDVGRIRASMAYGHFRRSRANAIRSSFRPSKPASRSADSAPVRSRLRAQPMGARLPRATARLPAERAHPRAPPTAQAGPTVRDTSSPGQWSRQVHPLKRSVRRFAVGRTREVRRSPGGFRGIRRKLCARGSPTRGS